MKSSNLHDNSGRPCCTMFISEHANITHGDQQRGANPPPARAPTCPVSNRAQQEGAREMQLAQHSTLNTTRPYTNVCITSTPKSGNHLNHNHPAPPATIELQLSFERYRGSCTPIAPNFPSNVSAYELGKRCKPVYQSMS